MLLNEKLPAWTEQGPQLLERTLTSQNKSPKEVKLVSDAAQHNPPCAATNTSQHTHAPELGRSGQDGAG